MAESNPLPSMTAPAVRDEFSLAEILSPIGLKLDNPNLPYEDFETICFVLGKIHTTVRFAIGDALIKGELIFGEKAYQAFEALNLSEEARREYRRVSSRVPISRRRVKLTWSHHRAVAALTHADGITPDVQAQTQWLKRAEDEQLSHHALRDAMRNGSEPTEIRTCRCCHRPYD